MALLILGRLIIISCKASSGFFSALTYCFISSLYSFFKYFYIKYSLYSMGDKIKIEKRRLMSPWKHTGND